MGRMKQIRDAVEQAYTAGSLSGREYRRFRLLMISPLRGHVAEYLEDEAKEAGFIDWENFDSDKFAKFIQVIIDAIRALLPLFYGGAG